VNWVKILKTKIIKIKILKTKILKTKILKTKIIKTKILKIKILKMISKINQNLNLKILLLIHISRCQTRKKLKKNF